MTRIVYIALAILALMHFALLFFVAWHVSWPSAVAAALSVAILFLPTRRLLSNYLPLDPFWVRAVAFFLLIAGAHLLLEHADRPEIVRTRTAFANATVITGQSDVPAIEHGVVLMDDAGVIVEVGSSQRVNVPSGYTIVDLQGKFLMPGLINAHGHLMLPGKRDPDTPMEPGSFSYPDWMAKLMIGFMNTYVGKRLIVWTMERNTQKAVRAGVTTLRAIGDPHYLDVAVRQRIRNGRTIGPRLLVAGPIICAPGGHAHQIGLVVDGPEQARATVRASLARGVDVIKIASTGGVSDSTRVGEAGELQMGFDEIAAIVEVAHDNGVLVTSHTQSTEGIKQTLRAGVDNIEHGAALDDEAVDLFINNPRALRGYSSLHPTLSMGAGLPPLTDEIRNDPAGYIVYQNGKRITEGSRSGYKTAVKHGIRLGIGTDAGLIQHGAVWKELRYFTQHAELSNSQALHIGTLATARSIGVDKITGSIEKGKSADLIILDRDPREDLSALAQPSMVIAKGVVVFP